jgi:murein L,D-transpeptidase YafK
MCPGGFRLRRSGFRIVFFLFCAVLFYVFSKQGVFTRVGEPEVIVEDIVNKKPFPDLLVKPKIVIKKSERILELYSDGEVLRKYPIGLGFNPEGDKEKEGDGRTPEGEYYICVKNPASRFYKSLGLSYPNIADANRGTILGLISLEEAQSITEAIGGKRRPPWKTKLGGEIFIHGHGAASDWTLGCVALEDAHIAELFNALKVGVAVTISK